MTSQLTAVAAHPVLRVPPASPAAAVAHFGASLAFHTDVSDVAAALAADGDPGFVLLDTVIRADPFLTRHVASGTLQQTFTQSRASGVGGFIEQ